MKIKELKKQLETVQTEKQKQDLINDYADKKTKGCFSIFGAILILLVMLIVLFGLIALVKLLFGYIF